MREQRVPLQAPRRDGARQLRRNETPPERRFRRGLADIVVPGSHFRRQAPIGPFVVDFVSHRFKLAIELDGDTHGTASQIAKDRKRTAFLNGRGYRVLRFSNADVLGNPAGCLEVVKEAVRSIIDAYQTSPLTGEVDRRSRSGGGDLVPAAKSPLPGAQGAPTLPVEGRVDGRRDA